MNLLAIDSASSLLSVAVARGEKIEYGEFEAGMKQSEYVMNCIDEQMKISGLKPQELYGIVCMGGPGSFTGLRIGYSIAKALALALDIPFAPIPTLDCIAYSPLPCCGLVIPVIQARKGSFFYSFFEGTERLTADTEAGIDELAKIISKKVKKGEKHTIKGPGAGLLYNALPPNLKPEFKVSGQGGYARELISIAKNREIFHNDNTVYLYTGPDYKREGS